MTRSDPPRRRWDDASDEQVLAAYLTGPDGQAAFTELVDRYERRVYSICYRYFGNHADAQDATQDTLLTVARRATSFAGESRLSTWLYRVTVNACNDLARRYARRPAVPVADVEDRGGGAPDEIGARETLIEVQRALLQLDELSRSLLILVAIEGLPYQAAARVLDLPLGTVKSRVHRARARLAELLAESDAQPLRAETGEPVPHRVTPTQRHGEPRGKR